VSCRQISHTPCGSDLVAPVRAAGYAYSSFAENLYVGSLGSASARDVVSAWLQSPGHRVNILNPGFRDVGTALVRADGVFYEGAAVVWIAAFAPPCWGAEGKNGRPGREAAAFRVFARP
jgi:uncharacterized protein YkwD